MPTYDYACSGCGHGFERFEPIGRNGAKKCPKCGARKARRMLGIGAGVIFKGAGFYTTDSRKSGSKGSDPEKKTGEKSDGKDDKGKEKKDEKKTEAKKEESKK